MSGYLNSLLVKTAATMSADHTRMGYQESPVTQMLPSAARVLEDISGSTCRALSAAGVDLPDEEENEK